MIAATAPVLGVGLVTLVTVAVYFAGAALVRLFRHSRKDDPR